MIAKHTLAQIVRDLIGRGGEGVYWDFKLKHHAHKGDLVHDVLCLANAEHDGPRFLVFGVEDGGVSVQTIEDNDRRRTQADIAGLFRDNASTEGGGYRRLSGLSPISHLNLTTKPTRRS